MHVLAYAHRPNYGSDREVGFRFCNVNSNHITAKYVSKEDFVGDDPTERLLKVDKYLSFIPRRWRFYFAHLEFQLLAYCTQTENFIVVSFTQVCVPILYGGNNILYGPMGTTLPFEHGLLSKLTRTYIYWNILRLNYRLFVPKNANVAFVHPFLADRLGFLNAPVFTALDFSYIESTSSEGCRDIDVIAVIRNVSFKRKGLIESTFAELAKSGLKCVIVNGDSQGDKKKKGFTELGRRSRLEVLSLFKRSKLHFFPSYELAGFVVGEAIMSGCPSLCYENNGGDFLLAPTEKFVFSKVVSVKSKIESIVSCPSLLEKESQNQKTNFLLIIDKMKKKKALFYGL